MAGEFDIGDMGMTDAFGLSVEAPTPQSFDDAGLNAAAMSGPGGLTASMAEIGLAASAG